MDPLHKPEHDNSCPFPEEALRHDTYQGVTLNISKLTNTSPRNTAQFTDPKCGVLKIVEEYCYVH